MSRKIVLATGFDQPYFPKARPYLESVALHGRFDQCVAICLDFLPSPEDQEALAPWCFTQAASKDIVAPHSNKCMQHGAFLVFLDLNADDVVLFTDSDIRMQRQMWAEEWKVLQGLKYGEVWVGENKDKNETLLEEASYLRPIVPVHNLPAAFTETNISQALCYNTGIVAATVQTYAAILEDYARLIGSVDCMFEHYARQQWLISYVLAFRGDLWVRNMPQTFHLHGCHGPKPGTNWNGLAHTYHGVDVLFAHNLDYFKN
ncbi:MAG: hypothetical protein JSS66_05020 [Armatimonadetes bacterium]|nr:hypothetical protein [Armatimonadota bacterium]